MRRIGHHLGKLFQLFAADIIQKQGKQYGQRKFRYQRIKAQRQRVPYQIRKLIGFKKSLKVLQAHPGASPYAIGNSVILKSQLDPIHGKIAEQQDINHHGKDKKIAAPASSQFFQAASPVLIHFVTFHICSHLRAEAHIKIRECETAFSHLLPSAHFGASVIQRTSRGVKIPAACPRLICSWSPRIPGRAPYIHPPSGSPAFSGDPAISRHRCR